MKKTFSISEAISFGWSTFKSNWKFWVVAFLLAMGIGSASGYNYTRSINNNRQTPNYSNLERGSVDYSGTGLEFPQEPGNSLLNYSNFGSDVLGVATGDNNSMDSPIRSLGIMLLVMLVFFVLMLPLIILFALVSGVLKMGYINLTLDAARDKQVYYKTLLNQVSLKKSLRFLTAQFLVGLIVVLGFILFIVPGIIFAIKYLFVPFIVVDEDAKIGESLKKSSQLTKGIRTKLLGMVIVFGLITLLGFFALGYGVIAAAIVVSLAKAYVYNTLSGQSEVSVSQPDVSEPTEGIETAPVPSEGKLASNEVSVDKREEEVVGQSVS